MATRIFQWGTVRSTPKGVSLVFGSGNRFDLSFRDAESTKWYINFRFFVAHISFSLIRMEWGPRTQTVTVPYVAPKATPKSIFRIGRADAQGVWAPGTTPTLLNYDDAMELAGAIGSVMGSAKTQTAMAVP